MSLPPVALTLTRVVERLAPDEALRKEVQFEVKRGSGRRWWWHRARVGACVLAAGLWIGFAADAQAPPTPAAAEDTGVTAAEEEEKSASQKQLQALLEEADSSSLPTAARSWVKLPAQGREDGGPVLEAYYVGGVRWLYTLGGERIRLQADQLVVYVFARPTPAAPENRAEAEADDTPPPEGSRVAPPGGEDRSDAFGTQWDRFKFFAQGRVRIDLLDRETHIEADSFFYEHPKGAGVARQVRMKTTVERAEGLRSIVAEKSATTPSLLNNRRSSIATSPVVVRASLLRIYHFRYYHGEDLQVSNSTFAVPPVSLNSGGGEVYPVDMTAEERQQLRERAARDGALIKEPLPAKTYERAFIIDPDDTWVYALDQPTLPLPMGYWDTRWRDYLPVNELYAGRSSEFGAFGGAQWNLNYFARLLPGSDTPLFREIDKDLEVGFDTIEYQKRGFGWGPIAEYGRNPERWEPWQLQLNAWNYGGEAQYFAIQDQGDMDRATRLPIPQRDRDWTRVWHRQAIPHVGLFDVELSDISDRGFLDEYFEREAKTGKEQETVLYWRRHFRDNLAVTGLAKQRTNDFQTQTERLPEANVFVFQQQAFGTGFYTDASAQAAALHLRSDDALGLMSRRFERYDLFNEWAYPVDWLHPAFDVRPFYFTRYTYYSDLLNPGVSSDDRTSLGTGVTVSQQLRRVFHFGDSSFMNRVVGLPNLKHMVVPSMTYLNVFSSDLNPNRTIVTDAVDTVDSVESFALSLRNDFLTRHELDEEATTKVNPLVLDRNIELDTQRFRTVRILESDISLVIYPQPRRDNRGDHTSFLRLDNEAQVGPTSIGFWTELNPNRDLRMERADAAFAYRIVPDRFVVSVGDRYTRNRTNAIYTDARWWMTEKWAAGGFWSFDTDEGRDIEIAVNFTRIFHRFAMTFDYVEDVGEDRNRSFYVSVTPVELFEQRRFRDRWRR